MTVTPIHQPASSQDERCYFVVHPHGDIICRLDQLFDRMVLENDLGYHLFMVEQNLANRSFSSPVLYEQSCLVENGVCYKRSHMPLQMAGLEAAYRCVIHILNTLEQEGDLSKKDAAQQDEGSEIYNGEE